MKPIPTQAHGVLDYLSVSVLLTLPRVFRWSETATRLMTVTAAATLGYSALTRYELGVFRVLPMEGHLALDRVVGAALCGAPFLFLDEDASAKAAMAGLGLFSLVVPALTERGPSPTG